MQFERPICYECRHLNRSDASGIKCAAFTKGIPRSILHGENDHSKPLPQQGNEIVFESMNDYLEKMSKQKGA